MSGSVIKAPGRKLLCIMLGGALGGIFRYTARWTSAAYLDLAFPVEILGVNIIASFFFGFFMGRIKQTLPHYKEWYASVCIGFLGGLSTFSSFALDTILLMERNEILLASANVILNVSLCLVAVRIGYGKRKADEHGG